MKNDIGIGNAYADLIIGLCKNSHEIKGIYENKPDPLRTFYKWTYQEVKQRTDIILGSLGINGVLREIRDMAEFIRNMLKIYSVMPDRLGETIEIIPALKKILNDLIEFELRLVQSMNEGE